MNSKKVTLNKDENQELDILSQITNLLSKSLNLDTSLQKIFEVLSDKLNLQKALLVRLTSKQKLILKTSFNIQSQKEYKHEELFSLTEKIIKQNSYHLNENEESKQRLFLGNKKIQSAYMAFPITIDNENLGVLHCLFCLKTISKIHLANKLMNSVVLLIGQEIKLASLARKETEKLKDETRRLQSIIDEKYNFKNIIGNSKKIKEVFKLITQVSPSKTNILILGENGTGKELIAHAIHQNSTHSKEPFIAINCAAIPENLIESELFGHEKGAFTDAFEQKKGKFELAENGSIFLDEIAELPLNLQVKLLRVLQEKEFTRIGGRETIKYNARIISATNQNLKNLIEEKKFREDLYYRLNVFPIHVPPLRERKEDILILTNHFLDKYSHEAKKNIKGISATCLNQLHQYHWPGNVRQLENVIERAVLLCEDTKIYSKYLPPELQDPSNFMKEDIKKSLKENVNNFEKNLIEKTLYQHKGNCKKTALVLQSSERIINYKIKKLGICVTTIKKEISRQKKNQD